MATMINFRKVPEVVYLDTRRIPTEEEVKDFWRNNHDEDDEFPEEGSDEYCQAESTIKSLEFDDFKDNFQSLGLCLVHGFAGLWDGNHEGGKVIEIDTADELFYCVRGCDDVKVVCDKDGLHVIGYHHDGTNTFTVKPLTKKGKAYWEHHAEQSYDVHHHLLDTKGYLKRIRYYIQ